MFLSLFIVIFSAHSYCSTCQNGFTLSSILSLQCVYMPHFATHPFMTLGILHLLAIVNKDSINMVIQNLLKTLFPAYDVLLCLFLSSFDLKFISSYITQPLLLSFNYYFHGTSLLMEHLFAAFHFQSLCIFVSNTTLTETNQPEQVVFFYSINFILIEQLNF